MMTWGLANTSRHIHQAGKIIALKFWEKSIVLYVLLPHLWGLQNGNTWPPFHKVGYNSDPVPKHCAYFHSFSCTRTCVVLEQLCYMLIDTTLQSSSKRLLLCLHSFCLQSAKLLLITVHLAGWCATHKQRPHLLVWTLQNSIIVYSTFSIVTQLELDTLWEIHKTWCIFASYT